MVNVQKVKQKKYPVSTVYLQIVGAGSPGSPRALYAFTEHCRYLFNCGEGTQRLANEHKVKLGGLEHVLVTHNSWENVGGMPGMLLTLQDAGVPLINIYGPPGIDFIYNDTKNFMRFTQLEISSHSLSENSDFKNHGGGPLSIKVVPIPKQSTETKENLTQANHNSIQETEALDLFNHERKGILKRLQESRTEEEQKKYMEDVEKNKYLAIAYICRPPSKCGSLLSKRCFELGVPKGPLLGQLKAGKDVVLDNGKVIEASEVTSPPEAGPVFIVIEIPTHDHLDSLLSCDAFKSHQSGGAVQDIAQVVVHFTPHDIMKHPSYTKWTNMFPPNTSHMIINDHNTCMGSERVHKVQYKLNHLYPDSFPLLSETQVARPNKRSKLDPMTAVKKEDNVGINFKLAETEDVPDVKDAYHFNGKTHQGFSMMAYHLRPNLKFEFKTDLTVNPELYIKECYDQVGFAESYKMIQTLPNLNGPSEVYPNIIFLGTGSCIPNKTRNTSGILLNISSTTSVILDCGEGTYGQMIRMMGLEQTIETLIKVKAIYVSHLHADHHIGLIRLILSRKAAFQSKHIQAEHFLLLAPGGIRQYLGSFDSIFEPILDQFVFVNNNSLNKLNSQIPVESLHNERVSEHLSVASVETCYVRHCPHAYGIAITFNDKWKVTYSGDTMPCDNLIKIGQDSDLLIHEATMEDSLKEDAIHKRHSTISDAIEMGVRMGARYEILTHFSQRYAKVPLLDSLPANVSIAFDNMQVRLKDLDILPQLYEAFVKIFSEDYGEMLVKTEKKRKAKESLLSELEKIT